MALLAAVSFLGALLEAGLLVIITGVAMALVANRSTVGPVLGQSVDLGSALALGALILVIRLALNVVTVRISSQLTTDVTTDQRLALSHAYLRASWSVQQAERAGRLQELLTSFVTRATWTINVLTQSITSSLSLLAFMVAGLLVDPLSAIAVMVALILVGTVLTPLKRRVRARSSTFSQSNLAFSRAVSELAALGLEMQTFGVQDRFAERIDSLTLETSGRQRSVQTLTGLLAPVYISLAYAALLAGVALLNVVGVSNLTVVGAVMLLMLRSLSYGQQLATAWGSVAANAPFLDRLDETVQRYSTSPARTGSIVPSGVTPVEATDVAFGYLPDRLALSSASFTLERGEIVGVIGPSGGGKSTLAQLLLGVRDPTAGAIRVGGVDLREVDRAWWSKRVAFVAQDALLLTGTVTENIRFLRPDVDDAAVVGAATRANILRDIEALPDGFATHLGERGSQLSGGQRQRLSIARALAGNPELLVLDEPTSALDGQSESLIRDTLTDLKGVVTVVMIAHRMSTLDICDRIMVIERGRLTGFGTPAALQKADGFYRHSLSMAGLSER